MSEDKGFVVKDRRYTSSEDQGSENMKKTDEQKSGQNVKQSQSVPKDKKSEDQTPLPEINFSMFIFSLNSSALVQLGLLEDPATGQKSKNLPLAKQTIDILGMLEEKTRGNLTKDEEGLLKHLLYDLRMLYVKEKG